MKSDTLPSFWEAYRSLDKSTQRRARKAFQLWAQNPFHPSLRFKCISAGENIWSVRVKSTVPDSRTQVRQVLREAKMLYEPNWETPPPVAQEERARLAKKLSQGEPLSDTIVADREDRV